jgi:hypothetical protein
MSTAPAPTGTLSRRGTHEPTGPQTQPFDTMPGLAGRTRMGLVPDLLAVGARLVFAVDALALGQICYGGYVSSDASGGVRPATGTPSLTSATWVAVSPEGTTVYDAPFNGRGVAVFSPAPAGQLTNAACVSNDGSGGACADLPGRTTDRGHPLASTPRIPPTSPGSLSSPAGTGPDANSRIRTTG